MSTLAIIAEYNPFHNGHMYHLNKAKELTGADYAIALMSGNFLQRGVPAMWDKYTRSYMCTSCGIDLALELPFPYATGSAMDFAMGAVSILNKLNYVNYICFGAETDDLKLLGDIAQVVVNEPGPYKNILKDHLASGMSYPMAREKALINYLNRDNLAPIISQPNNILAIEYICALIRTNSSIKPILIKRKQAMYHDDNLYGSISSATAIRNALNDQNPANTTPIDVISKDLPDQVAKIINDTYMKSSPIYSHALTPFLQSKLISHNDYENICDINIDFSNKLNSLTPNITFDQAVNKLSTKDITKTRASRNLIHLILDYRAALRGCLIDKGYAIYANILSFKRNSSSLIKEINNFSSIPLITKKADFNNYLSNYDMLDKELAKKMWELDTKATSLYNCLIYNTYSNIMDNDYKRNIPIS